MGDLNYRVSLPEEHAKDLILLNQIDELLLKDQLTQEREAQRAFANFKEGQISFNPTYKFEVGTDNYYDGYFNSCL